ncbi:MAG: leucyl aminopeptidase family protein [Pseudomonadota bacterium]
MHAAFAPPTDDAVPVHLVDVEAWESGLFDDIPFAKALGFGGRAGEVVKTPTESGALGAVLFGLGEGDDALALAALSAQLGEGVFDIVSAPERWRTEWSAAGWADGAYRFTRYLNEEAPPPRLVVREDGHALSSEADAVALVRDLVNTPAQDMGPDAIETAVRGVGAPHGAEIEATVGDDLLAANYPLIHAVGRAGPVAPRLVELSWGREDARELAIVGKGVAFDTGGLNLKTGGYMRDMKKDMGGAAHAIALAKLVMDAGLDVRLKLYIPTVENSISAASFRPGDILSSRKGLTVEIDNTDAEGRLILADALTRACEGEPDLLIDFATLTGAARVALGADLAPFYTDDEALAGALQAGSADAGDPAWRMPLWDPYLSDLKSSVADIVNSGGRFAGSITAALFLKKFVDAPSWAHFDIWAWRLGKYGRPAGGAATGLRAAWAAIRDRYA